MDITKFYDIAQIEYNNIVDTAIIRDENALRIILLDKSSIDAWFSLVRAGRYSYDCERKQIDVIYRHDNVPHLRWKNIPTYPKHFHNKEDTNVKAS